MLWIFSIIIGVNNINSLESFHAIVNLWQKTGRHSISLIVCTDKSVPLITIEMLGTIRKFTDLSEQLIIVVMPISLMVCPD